MKMRLILRVAALWLAAGPLFAQTRNAPVVVDVAPVPASVGNVPLGAPLGGAPGALGALRTEPVLRGIQALPEASPAPLPQPVIGAAPVAAPRLAAPAEAGSSVAQAAPIRVAAPAQVRAVADGRNPVQPLAAPVQAGPSASAAPRALEPTAEGRATRSARERTLKQGSRTRLALLADRPASAPAAFDGAAALDVRTPEVSARPLGAARSRLGRAAEPDAVADKPVPPPAGGEGGGAGQKGLLGRLRDWAPAPGERVAILLVAPLWNAFVIGAAYLINPIRLAFLQLDFGLTGVAASYVASGVGLGLGFWLYKKLTHLPRAKIVALSTVALGSALLGWWGVAALLAANPALGAWTLTTPWFTAPALGKIFSFAFNLFGDVFAMMSVTVSATYLVDVFRGQRAKKYFPVIFGAGSLGGLAGSLFVLNFVKAIGPLPIMLISASIYLTTLLFLGTLERWSRTHPPEAEPKPEAAAAAPQKAPNVLPLALLNRFPFLRSLEDRLPDVVRHILADRLLLLFFALKLLERVVPDFANFLFESEMRSMFPGAAYRDAAAEFRALFAVWQQSISFLAGMAFSTALIKRIGVGWAAATSPIANAVGSAAYALFPGMPAAYGLNQVEGGLRYVVMKPAVERGWTQVPKRIVYVVKPFLDAFVYRGLGRILSGITLLVLGPKLLGLSAVTIAGMAIPLALLAVYNALQFGKAVQRREAETEGRAAAAAPAPVGK